MLPKQTFNILWKINFALGMNGLSVGLQLYPLCGLVKATGFIQNMSVGGMNECTSQIHLHPKGTDI